MFKREEEEIKKVEDVMFDYLKSHGVDIEKPIDSSNYDFQISDEFLLKFEKTIQNLFENESKSSGERLFCHTLLTFALELLDN